MKRLFLLLLLVSLPTLAQAQFIEDALRLSPAPSLVGTRSAGMGNAFIGVADDATALYWNPAGLGQLRLSDFTIGFSSITASTDAALLSAPFSTDNSAMMITNAQLAIPFPVARGSFVIAAGYTRLADYTGAMGAEVFNNGSSIQRSLYNSEEDLDFAWNLGLEDTLVLTYIDEGRDPWLAIPVNGRVQQTIDVLEDGGLNLWSFGGSIEVAPNAMVGIALNVISGSYSFDRTFVESDVQNAHQGVIVGIDNRSRSDFRRLELQELVEQDLSGFNLRLGFLYNYRDRVRAGVTIQTGGSIQVNEDYFKTGRSEFADANLDYELTILDNNYTIFTPAVYGFGLAVNPVEWTTIALDYELVDYTALEFEDSNNFNTSALNRDIRRLFRSGNNLRAGAELRIPNTGLALRGGFAYRPSAYREDEGVSDYDTKTFSFGLGYTFSESVQLNASFTNATYSSFTSNYVDPDSNVSSDAYTTDMDITITRLMFGLNYRF